MERDLGIIGLEWQQWHAFDNGGGSIVVPVATTHLVHLVFHGEEPFSHGHYGYHVGLEDRLTFLGPPGKVARGYFVDCRKGSPTLHRRVTFEFTPDSKRTLRIPCGVAHCFDGLEGVYTLNSFSAFLPPPQLLLTDKSPWATGADIRNFPLTCRDEDLPVVEQSPYPASERFYELLSAMQAESLGGVDHEYPFTQEVSFDDGTSRTLQFRKRLSEAQHQFEPWEPVAGIDGLGWKKHLTVWSSDDAGYVALTDYAPIQVIDHGTGHYATDAYGIHLEWEDRLTFVGPPKQKATIRFIDCRVGSPTHHQECAYEFYPSPLRYLVIPAGVAHAFDGLENIFTINRPRRCAGTSEKYEPGNDVIDWPLHKRPAPSFEVAQEEEFPFAYYHALASMQREYLSSPTVSSTAAVLLVDDGTGKQVKVALRAQ